MNNELTFEMKLEAMAALGDLEVCYRPKEWRIGSSMPWYVHQKSVDIKRGRVVEGSYGEGTTPQSALEAHWRILTELKPDQYIILNVFSKTERRCVKWNGFMWGSVPDLDR